MRTTDFSRAPKQGRAEALVIAEFGRASARRTGRDMRSVRGMPGYVWHRSYRRAGTPGLIVFFDTAERAGAYRAQLESTGDAVGTQLLLADPSGYSNGVWRAEGNVMAHIPTFTPTSVEAARGSAGPPVASPPARSLPARTRPPAPTRTRRFRRNPETGRKDGSIPAESGVSTARPARSVTDARAMFVGATRYRGPRALVQLSRTWYPMVARMQTLRGYVWHTVYWEPPFTLGTLAFFTSRDDLLSFARLPAHRTLMQWITRDTRNGTGGYIRLHLAPGERAEPLAAGADDGAAEGSGAGGGTDGATP